jgi:hypothetical protein
MAILQPEKAYILKIVLDEIQPPIWRTVLVPETLTLDRLHDVIQIVMGWQDDHAHLFMLGEQHFAPDPDAFDMDWQCQEEGRVRIMDLLTQPGQSLKYEYDFGDSWWHTVTLQEIQTIPDNHQVVLTCLEGKKACPPEDVGGPGGFMRFCQIMKDPSDPEYEEMKEWLGGKFKPYTFDQDQVNHELAKYELWSRPRFLDSQARTKIHPTQMKS